MAETAAQKGETGGVGPWIGEALIVGAFSVTAYGYAYQYELAYCSYFGVPRELVEVTPNQVFRIVFYLIPLMVLVSPILGLTRYFARLTRNIHCFYAAIFAILIAVQPVFFGLRGFVQILKKSPAIDIVLVFGFAALLLSHWLVGRPGKGLRQSVSNPWLPFVLLLWVSGFIVFNLQGQGEAFKQKNFLVVDDSHVVIRRYDDRLVCAEIDTVKKRVLGKFQLQSVSNEEGLVLTFKTIGPLSSGRRPFAFGPATPPKD